MVDWVAAVVLAAGLGVRMGTSVPKQFLTLGKMPLLVHSLRLFEHIELINEVILVVAESDSDHCRKEIVSKFSLNKVSQVVVGGSRRQDSVWNGLQAVKSSTKIALLHDAVRPFVTETMVCGVINGARNQGAAIIAIPMRDTVKRVGNDKIIESTLHREELWLAQTPQAFQLNILKKAHLTYEEDGLDATDDAMMVEKLGQKVSVIFGSFDNIKITCPEDLIIGEAILNARMNSSPI